MNRGFHLSKQVLFRFTAQPINPIIGCEPFRRGGRFFLAAFPLALVKQNCGGVRVLQGGKQGFGFGEGNDDLAKRFG